MTPAGIPLFLDPVATPGFKRTLFNAMVAPRPIAWVSSMNPDGNCNLAPFSHFNMVSTAPAVLMFSCNTPSDREEKDTIANVRSSGEFVVNLVSRSLVEAMNRTSAPVPYGVDEFELANVSRAPSTKVRPPRVAEAPASFECRLLRFLKIEPEGPEDTSSTVVFGRIVGIHVAPGLIDAAGRFKTADAHLMTRLGGTQYAEAGATFELPSAFARAGNPA